MHNGDWYVEVQKQYQVAGWHRYSAENLKVKGSFLREIEDLIDSHELDLEQEMQVDRKIEPDA